MLAPLDQFHEQVVAVPRGAEREEVGVRCGWHGDLERVPAGFATELAIWAGTGPRRVLSEWAGFLLERHATRRPSRYADDAVGRLSYWTDNGAAYYYRTEPGLDMTETLVRVAGALREQRVPFRAVQLDSWFYPHQVPRPLNTDQTQVPPTGMLAWEPPEDLLPGGISALREKLGSPPLILHSRHFSSASSYFEREPAWRDGDRAHPASPRLLERLLDQAARWGAIQYEQDWLVESFLGVRGLREEPGRARAWQEGMDRAAAERGLSLLWCMATPADFLQTLTLSRVVSIRTSGDYTYLIPSELNWAWYLYTNALARALGLTAFKDVFLSDARGEGRDGDPNAELEALLSVLGAGPVGIGDAAGRTDRARVLRTCREDGVLVKPDAPVAALDRCFRRHVFLEPAPLVGETSSTHPAGRWTFLLSIHAWRGDEPLRFEVALADLGESSPAGPCVAYDWRTGTFERLEPDARIALALEPRAWDYRVLDVSKFVTVGDRRLRGVRVADGLLELEVLGAPGEAVALSGWAAAPPRPLEGAESLDRDADGRWTLRVRVGPGGSTPVRLALA
jgi:hypothetical protein